MARLKIRCTDCEACSINGLPCHETGCPAARRPWVEWNGYLIPGDLPHDRHDDESHEDTGRDYWKLEPFSG